MEKYVIKPNLKFYAVYEVTGEQKEEILNTSNEQSGVIISIKQNIDGLNLKSEREISYKINYKSNEIPVKETSIEEIILPKGIKLVYIEGRGYTLSEFNLCTVEDAINDLKVLEEV